MAMLLDGPPSTIEDLTLRDSDLMNLAVSEGIDLTAKLKLAAAEIGITVESMLMSARSSRSSFGQPQPGLKHIAVTQHLKLWHIYASLRLIYQDLYYTRLNDRYRAKMKLYREEEARMLDEVRATGLGVVFDPLPQALAPNIRSVQTSDAGGVMYVAVAFVNLRGEEGLMSVPVEADTQDGSASSVTLSALADNAVGWNLYAGLAPDALTRQNSDTLDPLASSVLAPGRLSAGPQAMFGQQANMLYPVPRRMLRG